MRSAQHGCWGINHACAEKYYIAVPSYMPQMPSYTFRPTAHWGSIFLWVLQVKIFFVKLAHHTFNQEPAHWGSKHYKAPHTTLKLKPRSICLTLGQREHIASGRKAVCSCARKRHRPYSRLVNCLSPAVTLFCSLWPFWWCFLWQIQTKLVIIMQLSSL